MKLHKINDIPEVRFIKLCGIAIYLVCRSYRRYDRAVEHIRLMGIDCLHPKYYKDFFYDLISHAISGLFTRSLIFYKYIIVDYFLSLGHTLDQVVIRAYICERLGINVEFRNKHEALCYFENGTLINRADSSGGRPYHSLRSDTLAWFGVFAISSEYGHKIISKLSIKEDFKKAADEWFDKHIKGNWVAVHYRGTDTAEHKKELCINRYKIELDAYIIYLQNVLDNQCSIFACSDQQQFIDKMCETFPGRVFARDIQRSYDDRSLHGSDEYKGIQQQKDAVIDMLILAKAKLIYTTGSGFVDATRYFNPKIKIISMDGRSVGRGKNNVPIPNKDLYDKLRIH